MTLPTAKRDATLHVVQRTTAKPRARDATGSNNNKVGPKLSKASRVACSVDSSLREGQDVLCAIRAVRQRTADRRGFLFLDSGGSKSKQACSLSVCRGIQGS